MPQNEVNPTYRSQSLTRNQILQYIAEMSDEMSNLAKKAECLDLAKSLKTASNEASHLLPQGYKD